MKRAIPSALGCLILALTFRGGAARADLFDAQTITNNTGTSQSQMNLVFGGDVTGAIDATVNPFGAGAEQARSDGHAGDRPAILAGHGAGASGGGRVV